MTKEYWEHQYSGICNTLKKYNNDDIALTKKQLTHLYKEKYFWYSLCEHWEKISGIINEYWEDEYGSHHTTYYEREYCVICGRELSSNYIDERLVSPNKIIKKPEEKFKCD